MIATLIDNYICCTFNHALIYNDFFRDKCGAAAVAGFFQVLSVLKPKRIKAVGYMSMVRNSVGTGWTAWLVVYIYRTVVIIVIVYHSVLP